MGGAILVWASKCTKGKTASQAGKRRFIDLLVRNRNFRGIKNYWAMSITENLSRSLGLAKQGTYLGALLWLLMAVVNLIGCLNRHIRLPSRVVLIFGVICRLEKIGYCLLSMVKILELTAAETLV